MAQTDTIADFIIRIKNAYSAKKEKMECPSSNMRESICKVLKREGFIRDFRLMKARGQGILRIYLKYSKSRDKIPAIIDLKRISKSSLRIYKKSDKIPTVLGGRGIAIVSTPKGILIDSECRDQKVGGEVLCYVW